MIDSSPVSTIAVSPGAAPKVGRSTSLLAAPMAAILVAVIVEPVTARLDARYLQTGRGPVITILDRGGADDVRAMVATVAGSAITVLALVLSLTMVTLSMAATQFGPRLTAAFLRARVVKATIGVFTGLFVYSLLVLDSIGSDADRRTIFVPELGASVVLVTAIVAVLCLVWYANSLAQSVRLPALVELVASDLREAITADRELRTGTLSAIDDDDLDALRRTIDADHVLLVGDRSGYLQAIEFDSLGEAAARAGATVEVMARPGDFLQVGAPLARVTPASAAAPLTQAVERHVDLGAFRTMEQDVEFGIDQLVEIALRALSPAINDTFTGITCIDWLGTGLRVLADGPGDRPALRDAGGTVRVVSRPRPLPGLVDACFDKIRQAGVDNPAITIHLLATIRQTIELMHDRTADERLIEQAHMVAVAASRRNYAPLDWDELHRRYTALCATVGHEPRV